VQVTLSRFSGSHCRTFLFVKDERSELVYPLQIQNSAYTKKARDRVVGVEAGNNQVVDKLQELRNDLDKTDIRLILFVLN
jgi:hypothetical protein